MEEILKQKRLTFLKEGVDFYAHDTRRRSLLQPILLSSGQRVAVCRYRTRPKGKSKKCFIGRYISDSDYSEEIESSSVSTIRVEKKLPLEIRELGITFLEDCQTFHDNSSYWNKRRGLTLVGKERLEEIKSIHCN